mgnify:CR=1 FL=1
MNDQDMTMEQTIYAWRQIRWPKEGDHPIWDLAKVAEEAGEVVGTGIKVAEGRATTDTELPDELGDLLIAISSVAGRHGWTIEQLRAARWAEVRTR